MPRLGLGLAKIRDGDLNAGREEIETAVILDPNNSLVRSYMGKAYYEEKRDKLAESQLEIAKELDPNDPTPWLYDAIRKQTVNRPVEALGDLQTSTELNNNRSVYRSALLLDDDAAARSASRGRIYRDLNFGEHAIREGWASVNANPDDYAGHRLLSDSYISSPRHERARVSELYQSQLLQPINLTPVQPQLGEANLFILDSAGPSSVAFNEFNPLFARDRLTVQTSGVVGGNNSWGNDAVFAGVEGRMSFSLGQFHFETDGFRENNDYQQDTLNAIVQFAIAPDTSLFAEVRSTDSQQGDLQLLFDPTNFIPNLRQSEEAHAIRLGLRHALSPRSQVLASAIYQTASLSATIDPVFDIESDIDGYSLELQHRYRGVSWWAVSGLRYIKNNVDELQEFAIPVPDPPFLLESSDLLKYDRNNLGGYIYASIFLPAELQIVVGASVDRLRGQVVDKSLFNPKIGLIWQPLHGTTIRVAGFRTLQEPTISRQNQEPRLEPTQVAGFNQLFFGAEGVQARRFGAGLDQVVTDRLIMGIEVSKRESEIPQIIAGLPEPVDVVDADESQVRSYAYWRPVSFLAIRGEYQYEKTDYNGVTFAEGFSKLSTHRIPIGASLFSRRGLSVDAGWTYVDQEGLFGELVPPFGMVRGSARFSVLDLDVTYRLPHRLGTVSVKASNLLNREFQFQDTDPENPQILPERFVVGRFTLAF